MKSILKVFVYLTVAFLLYYLWKNGLLTIPKNLNLLWLFCSLIPLFLGFLLQAFQWQQILRLHQARISCKHAIISVGLTIFGKYIPGKLWLIIGRAAYITSLTRISIKQLSMISLLSQLFTLWTGLLIGSLILFLQPEAQVYSKLALFAFVGLSVLIFSAHFKNLVERIISRLSKRQLNIPILRLSNLKSLIIPYLSTWIAWSLGFYLLLMAYSNNFIHFSALAIFPLSGTLGIMAIITPGGIGVREAAIVVLLSTVGFSIPEATSISALQRLWFLVGEAFIFIVALIFNKFKLHLEAAK